MTVVVAFVNQGRVYDLGSSTPTRPPSPWRRFAFGLATLVFCSVLAQSVHLYFKDEGATPPIEVGYDVTPLMVALALFAPVVASIVMVREPTTYKPSVLTNPVALAWGVANSVVAIAIYASLFLYDEFRSVMIGIIAGQGLLVFVLANFREIDNGTLRPPGSQPPMHSVPAGPASDLTSVGQADRPRAGSKQPGSRIVAIALLALAVLRR